MPFRGKNAHFRPETFPEKSLCKLKNGRRKIDKSLCAIIRKATAYDLAERYQTVDDLAEDLRRFMAGLSISASPDTLWDKLTRLFFRRHL